MKLSPGSITVLLGAIALMRLSALEWPSFPATPERSFGHPENGYLLAGIVLGSAKDAVLAADSGEIVYSRGATGWRAGLPPVSGGMQAIEHAGQFRTVYFGIQPNLGNSSNPISKGQIIGTWLGEAKRTALGPAFFVMDRASKAWVNPILLLPPLETESVPNVSSLALNRPGTSPETDSRVVAATLAAKGWGMLPQGEYVASVGTVGSARHAAPLAPFRLRLRINGVEQLVRSFEAAVMADEGLAFNGSSAPSGSGIDPEGRYRLGKVFIPRGYMTISVIVENSRGAEKEFIWKFDVR